MADEPTTDPEEVKADPAVSKLEKKNAALIAQINEFKSKFSEIESAAEAERAKREQEQAAAKGDYEKALEIANAKHAEMQSQMDAMIKAHADAQVQGQLERALIAKGATDEFFVSGVVAKYMQAEDRPELDAYLADVVEKSEQYFKPTPPPNTGAAGKISQPTDKDDWSTRKALMDDIRAGNLKGGASPPDALADVQKADAEARAYFMEHGEMPPEWTK